MYFNFGKEKTGFRIAMKKCRMRDSCEKGAEMQDHDPPPPRPLPDPVIIIEHFCGEANQANSGCVRDHPGFPVPEARIV